MHHGAWVSQKAIHDAGNGKHPDLYSQDMPVALANLGVVFDVFAKKQGFLDYLRTAVDAGDPVIAGAKILPTAHPEWGLDHFVLVVGYGPQGILANTTWDKQAWVTDTAKKGLTFAGGFYALRIRDVPRPKGKVTSTARAAVLTEGATTVTLTVSCASEGTLERRDSPTTAVPAESYPGKSLSRTVTVPRASAAWFRCVPPKSGN